MCSAVNAACAVVVLVMMMRVLKRMMLVKQHQKGEGLRLWRTAMTGTQFAGHKVWVMTVRFAKEAFPRVMMGCC